MEADQPSDANTKMSICSVTTAAKAASNDIRYTVSRIPAAEDRLRFLNPWMPSKEADFQSSLQVKSEKVRNRLLVPHHLNYFQRLGVSKVEGIERSYCIQCVLFPNDCGIGGRSYGHGQLAGKLIARPLTDFDELTGKAGTLSRHQAYEYHKDNVLLMENFKKTMNQILPSCGKNSGSIKLSPFISNSGETCSSISASSGITSASPQNFFRPL